MLTEEDWDKVVVTAPGHVEEVQRLIFDHLTAAQVRHLGASSQLITTFARRSEASPAYATDQLLNAIFLVTSAASPDGESRDRIVELLLKQLTTDLV